MPLVYKVDDNAEEITFMASLESAKDGSGAKRVTAMDRFKAMDTLGSAETKSTDLKSTHQNQISCIRILSGDKNGADKISTSGGDGKVVVWDLRSLEKQIEALKI